jgi:hypothetical protein
MIALSTNSDTARAQLNGVTTVESFIRVNSLALTDPTTAQSRLNIPALIQRGAIKAT